MSKADHRLADLRGLVKELTGKLAAERRKRQEAQMRAVAAELALAKANQRLQDLESRPQTLNPLDNADSPYF